MRRRRRRRRKRRRKKRRRRRRRRRKRRRRRRKRRKWSYQLTLIVSLMETVGHFVRSDQFPVDVSKCPPLLLCVCLFIGRTVMLLLSLDASAVRKASSPSVPSTLRKQLVVCPMPLGSTRSLSMALITVLFPLLVLSQHRRHLIIII